MICCHFHLSQNTFYFQFWLLVWMIFFCSLMYGFISTCLWIFQRSSCLWFLVYLYGQIRYLDFNVKLVNKIFEQTDALAFGISVCLRRICIPLLLWEICSSSGWAQLDLWCCLSLLFLYGFFCQDVPSITACGALKSPTISVLLFISLFRSTNIYFINLGVLRLCVCLFILVVSSLWINNTIII